jgi:hypothetical protein
VTPPQQPRVLSAVLVHPETRGSNGWLDPLVQARSRPPWVTSIKEWVTGIKEQPPRSSSATEATQDSLGAQPGSGVNSQGYWAGRERRLAQPRSMAG